MKNLILLIAFCLFYNVTICQSAKDDYYLHKLNEFTDTNNDSLLFYANKLKKSRNICSHYIAINKEAKAYYQQGDLTLSLEKTYSVLNKIKEEQDDCFLKQKITALLRLFWIFKNQNKFQDAFEVLLERKKVIQSLSKKDQYFEANLISTEHNLAIIKSVLGFDKEARKLLKAILPKLPSIYKDLNKNDYYLKLNITSSLNIIGESYLKTSENSNSKQLDSASIYFKKAYEVAQQFVPRHKDSEKLYKLREAQVLIAKKNYEDALKLICIYDDKNHEFKTKQNINSLKAICYYNLKQKDSSFYYSNLFLKNYKKKPILKKRLISTYDILANLYYKNKVLDSAYKYSELTLNEIKLLNENKNEVNKAYYLYDYKNANSLNISILKREKKNRQNFIIITSIVGILISFSIIYLLKKNKKIAYNLKNVQSEIEENSPQKKEYNIDEELEKALISGINELKYSKDFLSTGFNINVLAKKLNTNTSYLSYFINKEYNQSFKQYITQLRIDYLIEKLKEDSVFRNYTIKSLAEEIGYTNASAFTRAFKKHKGITPSEFIKNIE